MDFQVTPLNEDTSLVRLNGRLDSPGVDQIETRFIAAVVASNRNAVIDLSAVSFLASMGIRLFITNARAMATKGRRMAVFGASESVRSVLDAVALDQIIPVMTTEQQAVQAIGH